MQILCTDVVTIHLHNIIIHQWNSTKIICEYRIIRLVEIRLNIEFVVLHILYYNTSSEYHTEGGGVTERIRNRL